MKHKGKLAIATLAASVLFAATSAFAATATFSGSLPANQGDTEISTVARANEDTAVKYFSIKITSLGSGTYVRAWTEKSGGIGANPNLSDPYNQVAFDSAYHTINYSTVPTKGTNVILNLDNPVVTSSTVSVSGAWSPN
ncbi:DUF2712 domain-containing protein [Paenibacillus sediminis]|uniref:Uncharacterized protein n=1 Tax=Paenibacillus sediminis TaxID=664909 RepID=A0ABS4H425_9BACL|nr:DUF2712 domain-containing protein [Paenibacillus sediminis]MBP1937268.1 hypothetical protein [Paenibacillus sediminis]